MFNAPVVSILVISYNTCEMTLACLRSVVAQTQVPYELIVVDNASSDGSAAAIAAEFPSLTLLAETTNHGFAKANNIAARHAKGTYILLLNPDTVVLNGAIDALVAFAERKPQAQIWGGRTLFGDGRLNANSGFGQMTLWSVFCTATGLSSVFKATRLFNPEGYGGWLRDTERRVDVVSGCFLLLPRSLWERLGGFDLQFVMYGEEADLCLRAHKLGADPHITPQAEIVHYGGASEKIRVDKMVRLLSAKTLLIRRHFPAAQQGLGLWLYRLWPLTRWWAQALMSVFPGQGKRRDAANQWRAVWARRGEWQHGYAPLAAQ